MMVDAVRGVLRVRKWPRKSGRPTSARQLFWIDWFRQANRLAKYADAMSQARAIELTKGSGMYPRDIILQAMRGRLYTWRDSTGWKWYPVAAIGDISETLDVLAQTVGSVLVRAADRWRALAPGLAGDVLTSAGPGATPIFASPAPVTGLDGGALLHNSVNQSIPRLVITALTFDSELYDTHALHDPAVNPTRLTVPAGFVFARPAANIFFSSGNNTLRNLRFYKNGADYLGQGNDRRFPGATTVSLFQCVGAAVPVVDGDYFEAMAYHEAAGSLNAVAGVATTFSLQLFR